jgi:hypothetical protein
VALNNDLDQFKIVLEEIAENAIVDRHQANRMLFNAFFEKPGFREALLDYLATSSPPHHHRVGVAADLGGGLLPEMFDDDLGLSRRR